MERQLLPDDHLTEAVHHLVEEAVVLAGGHAPDARHLLMVILKEHAAVVQQLLPNVDLDALGEALQRELQNPQSHIAIPYEAIIELAFRVAEKERQLRADVAHVLKAIGVLTGLISRESVFPAPPTILQIGANLTEQVRQGALPRVVGREAGGGTADRNAVPPCEPLRGVDWAGGRWAARGGAGRRRAHRQRYRPQTFARVVPSLCCPNCSTIPN
jgi:ATP-dependent Clp protease ATP-binding subunit ClpA